MRVKGAVAPPVTAGFAGSGFLAHMSLTIVITVFKSCWLYRVPYISDGIVAFIKCSTASSL